MASTAMGQDSMAGRRTIEAEEELPPSKDSVPAHLRPYLFSLLQTVKPASPLTNRNVFFTPIRNY